ncbi:MAG: RNA methyltransferase, partial [Deltaproteobacteria bacterium]|nr:RNA methyltransferase [Deltaproteobacteria bacterium]
MIFGRHPVLEALRSEGAEVLEVKVARGVSAVDRQELRRRVESSNAEIAVEEISRDRMNRYTGAPRHDQGIAARVRLLRVTEVDAFLDGAKGKAARKPLRLLALDGVTNSQNVGMVVRSVVGAGLDGLLW